MMSGFQHPDNQTQNTSIYPQISHYNQIKMKEVALLHDFVVELNDGVFTYLTIVLLLMHQDNHHRLPRYSVSLNFGWVMSHKTQITLHLLSTHYLIRNKYIRRQWWLSSSCSKHFFNQDCLLLILNPKWQLTVSFTFPWLPVGLIGRCS